jgi:hypothetical protein
MFDSKLQRESKDSHEYLLKRLPTADETAERKEKQRKYADSLRQKKEAIAVPSGGKVDSFIALQGNSHDLLYFKGLDHTRGVFCEYCELIVDKMYKKNKIRLNLGNLMISIGTCQCLSFLMSLKVRKLASRI